MTRIALFHSILGLRPGVFAAADVFRDAGHQVEIVDQYGGRVFSDYAEASAFAESIGYPALMASALGAVADDSGPLVTAGFSNGAGMAEYVAGELTPNPAEVSDARWLTVDEICRMDGTFEGDRDFYRKILPALASSNKVAASPMVG